MGGFKKILMGMGGGANPSIIFGNDLLFWFDNTFGVTLTGGFVSSQVDRTGNAVRTAASGQRPLWNNNNEIEYDGINDQLLLDSTTASLILANNIGFVYVIADIIETTQPKFLFSADDNTTNPATVKRLDLTYQGSMSATAPTKTAMIREGGAGIRYVNGNSVVSIGVKDFGLMTDAVDYRLLYNGAEEVVSGPNNDGIWFNDFAGALNTIRFGALGRAAWSNYKEYHVLYVNREPTADELTALFNWSS